MDEDGVIKMPEWFCYVLYIMISIFSFIAQNVKDAERSRMFYTMAICLLATEFFLTEVL